jgi:hypothetical protein
MQCRCSGLALGVVVSALILTGCAGKRSSPPAADVVDVHICAAYNSDAQVIFSGTGAEQACAGLIRTYGARSEFWTRHDPAPETPSFQRDIVCRLAWDSAAALTLTVLDRGGHATGDGVCADYLAVGWHEL